MSKKSLIVILGSILVIVMVWFVYQKVTDDTYEGMSIIPEQHEDIPLFKGLKPTRNQYVMKGNHLEDIYGYYMSKLSQLGWKVEHEQSAWDDNDKENDWSGFYSEWRKDGFDGELWISAMYNHFDNRTEVIFDKTPINKSTSWIEEMPTNICIYEKINQDDCFVINDKFKIEKIKTLINKAIDLDKEKLPNTEKISAIDFGNIKIKVYYGTDEGIYFQSEKGLKIMKPEHEFFELTGLSH
ncbi:hypothetical protein [Falsibacillus pallidus]|uniref:hypothetical protein n=1 Tax=Falsibacillus pallidus TaxID=493781 RepID=UPI003D979EA4